MDRANSKHSRRLDDEMARETLGYTQGSGTGSRTEEWREAEPAAEGQPEASLIPDIESEDEELSRFGRYIPRTALPGDREKLLTGARQMHAPDEILAMIERLRPGRTYATVVEAWTDLR
jgi:hypothetical protein